MEEICQLVARCSREGEFLVVVHLEPSGVAVAVVVAVVVVIVAVVVVIQPPVAICGVQKTA